VRGPISNPIENWPNPPEQVAGHTIPTEYVSTLEQLQSGDPAAYAAFYLHGRSVGRWVGDNARKLGDLFLRLLKMVSIPLIVTSLLTGITSLGRADRLGRMFGRTLVYYLCTSAIAICIGLLMVNLFQPGQRADAPPGGAVGERAEGAGKSLGAVLFEQIETMIPPNPIA
jgi:Na+/H+-dicarboxylate symporter